MSSNITPSRSRRSFLRGSSLAAASAGAAMLGTSAGVSPVHAQFAPLGLPSIPNLRREFKQLRRHENNHVEFLLSALGTDARPKPTFQNLAQPSLVDLVIVSQALEQTGVGAYLGATPFINNPDILFAAARIALIEASHAAYLNLLNSDPITGESPDSDNDDVLGRSFYFPLDPDAVLDAAGPFVVNLNGGPPIGYSETPSAQNDIDILNFALALEFLEADFYNINVFNFFS